MSSNRNSWKRNIQWQILFAKRIEFSPDSEVQYTIHVQIMQWIQSWYTIPWLCMRSPYSWRHWSFIMIFSTAGMKRNFQRKGPSKSVHRVKALEKYCTELLQCDPSVTQSSEVVQFFCPKNHDLEPEFAKNRYVFFFLFEKRYTDSLKILVSLWVKTMLVNNNC